MAKTDYYVLIYGVEVNAKRFKAMQQPALPYSNTSNTKQSTLHLQNRNFADGTQMSCDNLDSLGNSASDLIGKISLDDHENPSDV